MVEYHFQKRTVQMLLSLVNGRVTVSRQQDQNFLG